MAGSHRRRKRQTRLSFTPLSSSSPAARDYNKQVRDRAAAVSIEGSPRPSKRRKIRGGDDGGNDANTTPDTSPKQIQNTPANDSDSEPVRSTQLRSSTREKASARRDARQRQLDFSSGRDPESFDSPVKLTSSARPDSSACSGIFRSQTGKSQGTLEISSDESDAVLPSSGKMMKMRKQKPQKSKEGRVTRSTQQSGTVNENLDDDDIVVRSRPSRAIETESEDDDGDMPTAPGTQRRKRGDRRRRNSLSGFISSSPPPALESDVEMTYQQGRTETHRHDLSDDEEEVNEPVTPSRRKLKRARQMSRQEEEDLADDLDFLGPSSDVEDSGRKPRNTQSDKKDARLRALKMLKQKRAGQAPIVGDNDQDMKDRDDDQVELYDDDDDDDDVKPFMSSAQMFKKDDDDEEFIENEDEHESMLGVPTDIPLEFTRYGSMKPKKLFRFAVDWMVQKKINPAFTINDEIYKLTFKKLDDEVKGLAGSKFTSAAWTIPFTVALQARPDIAFDPIDRTSPEHFMRDRCDACNRSSHPATFQIQFLGKPYDRVTLEEVAGNDDEDTDSNSGLSSNPDDEPGYDALGREIPPVNTIFYVGKFCMGNAQTAHALQHWRYHLNEWVVTWLLEKKYSEPEKIVERDRWSTRKRRKFANKIVDRMEEEGVVKTLWRDFRAHIDEARDSKQGQYSRESP